MMRKHDLERRLDDLVAALGPTDPAIVIVDESGQWTAGGDGVDPDSVDPEILIHLTARETVEIDEETLEIVGCEPRTDADGDEHAVDGGDGRD